MYYEVHVLRANVHFSIDENEVSNWWKLVAQLWEILINILKLVYIWQTICNLMEICNFDLYSCHIPLTSSTIGVYIKTYAY